MTVFTAAVKVKLVGKGLPAFPKGLLSGLNFAVSFLLMQAFGFVLATKQPAMTAATLATILREHRGAATASTKSSTSRHDRALAGRGGGGNVAIVAAGAWLFDLLFRLLAGVPISIARTRCTSSRHSRLSTA